MKKEECIITSQERIKKTLNHQEPDRVPIDLGGTSTSTITVAAYDRLKECLGLKAKNNIIDKVQQIVKPDEVVLTKLGIDTRSVWLKGPKNGGDMPLTENSYKDEWGIIRRITENGYYYDIVDYPLKKASFQDLDQYNWPDPCDPGRIEGLKEEVGALFDEADYAIVANFTGSIFEHAQHLRGFEAFFMDMILNQKFVQKLMDKILEFYLTLADKFFGIVGAYLDVVKISDDFGTQNGPIVSLKLYRKLVKPRQKELISAIKKKTRAKILLHSCGSISQFIKDFIEIGVDVLNPVQVSALGMSTVRLKKEFGNEISFWGGIDTQKILPYGTVKDVEGEVRRRIGDLAPGGGYVLSAVHNIQPDVNPENVCALYEAAIRYGTYPIGN